MATGQLGVVFRQFGRLFGAGQQIDAVGKERGAGFGDRNLARRSLQQLDAKFAFELGQVLADRRLGEAEPVGRRGKRTCLGNRDKDRHAFEVHSGHEILPAGFVLF